MVYVVIAIVAGMLADILFTMTTYKAPNARRVDIEFVGSYTDFTDAAPYEQAALEAGRAYELARDEAAGVDTAAEDYEVPLEEVLFLSLDYDPYSDDAYYGQQKYIVTLSAQEGDIFIVSRALMVDLVQQGLAVDLSPYIESGILDPGDRDLSRVTFDEFVEEGEEPTGKECIYALQAETLTKLWSNFSYDYRDTYMVIMPYSQNPDTAAAVMQSLIDQFTPTAEELAAQETAAAAAAATAEASATEAPAESADAEKGTDE